MLSLFHAYARVFEGLWWSLAKWPGTRLWWHEHKWPFQPQGVWKSNRDLSWFLPAFMWALDGLGTSFAAWFHHICILARYVASECISMLYFFDDVRHIYLGHDVCSILPLGHLPAFPNHQQPIWHPVQAFRIIRLTRILKTAQLVRIFRFVMALRTPPTLFGLPGARLFCYKRIYHRTPTQGQHLSNSYPQNWGYP